MGDKPVNYVSWFDAARVTNWLQKGSQTYVSSDATASAPQNTGAYALGTATSGAAFGCNPVSRYSIPSGNEWSKAAYWKGGGPYAGYWKYATGSDADPTPVSANATGDGSAGQTGNHANFDLAADWNGMKGNVTTVGTNGGPSAYGTYDQSGNVAEWNSADFPEAYVPYRGGGFVWGAATLQSGVSGSTFASRESADIGFRLTQMAELTVSGSQAFANSVRAICAVQPGSYASFDSLFLGVMTISGGTASFANGGSGSVEISNGGAVVVTTGPYVSYNGFGAALAMNDSARVMFTPAIDASISAWGGISGDGTLALNGAGSLTLSGSNSYSGGTEVNEGTLVAGSSNALGSDVVVVNGGTLDLASYSISNSITNNGGAIINAANYGGTQSVGGVVSMTGTIGGAVNVASSGELTGSGSTFNGPVSLAAGAQHSPGNSPGTQNFASGLSYSAGSILNWELIANTGTGAGTNYDFLSVTGGSLSIATGALLNLNFSGSGSTVSWSDPFWSVDHTWTIIDALSATSSTGDFTLGTISNDSLGQSLQSLRPDAFFAVGHDGNNVVLTFTAVPEPSTWVMGLAGIACAGWGVIRQSKRAWPKHLPSFQREGARGQ